MEALIFSVTMVVAVTGLLAYRVYLDYKQGYPLWITLPFMVMFVVLGVGGATALVLQAYPVIELIGTVGGQ